MVRFVVLAAVVATSLAYAGSVYAGGRPGPYQGQAGEVQKKVAGKRSAGQRTIGGLPFTGLELTVLVGAGLALVLTGTALRRASRRRAES